MDGNEGVSTLNLPHVIPRGKCFIAAVFIVSFIALLTGILFDTFLGALMFFSYIGGSIAAHCLIRNENPIPNVINRFKRQRTKNSRPAMHKVCIACGVINCKRHSPDLYIYLNKPWMDLKIPQEVDEALEEILNLVLEKHIYAWYSTLSTDDSFVQEIRTSLRFLFASLLKRALQVDMVPLITVKAASALFKHLDCYLQGKRAAQSPAEIEECVLQYIGNNLHTAMESRQVELSYLRQLTENLLPYIIQRKYLQCRSACSLVREIFCGSVFLPLMDIVADPDIVNHLLVLFFDKTPMVEYPNSEEPKAEFLSNFVSSHASNQPSVLHTSLRNVLEDQNLLYLFMNFLKDETAVSVLQFLLSVDDFNTRILNPDLTKDELEALHLQAQEMYNTYFAPNAVDRINFDDEVVHEIKEIIAGPPENVIKLRTTTPLFRAYDHVYGLLEQTYCPMFLQSDRYFHLLCGERWSSTVNKNHGRGNKKGNAGPSTMSKLGHKIKGVFAVNIDEGQAFEEEAGTDLAEALFSEVPFQPDAFGNGDVYRMEDDPRLKKLSAWRVFIPRVQVHMDQHCKYYHTFIVEVQRIDVRDDDNPDDLHWTVERRYNEFYVLEAKLTEFHGELSVQLPTKRSQGQKGGHFLESRRPEFEKFLQTLLTLPSLQGSELLYKFLKSPIPFTSSFLPDIRLGKMIRTVPMKLMKEKGQHLLPFLQAFLASTEAAKPKPSKLDWKHIHEFASPQADEKLTNGIFGNNLASTEIRIENADEKESTESKMVVDINEIYDYIVYLALEVVKVPDWLVQLLATCDSLVRRTLQAGTEWYLDLKLQQALKPQRLAELLNLVRDALFFDDDPPRTRRQKAERARQALNQAKDYFPGFLVTQKFEDGITLLFEALQSPLLNKQLSYVLLDILAVELFPELQEMHHNQSSPQ